MDTLILLLLSIPWIAYRLYKMDQVIDKLNKMR